MDSHSCGLLPEQVLPLELIEKLAALVPPPQPHLVPYSGCLAPNSKLRAQVIPTRRQRGVDSEEAKAPYWSWVRLLGRVFDLNMASCPLPPWDHADHFRHYPRRGDDPHFASSQTGLGATADCA